MRGSDPRLARLLRWYPRAWRDRYGVEFLAMVEDTLAGRRPGLRLRVNVAWAGLRQRGHDVLAGPVATRLERLHKVLWGRWWEAFLAGLAVALLEYDLAQPAPAHPRAWAVTTVLDALLAVAALAGVSVLVGLAAVASAFRRFLRDGGWTLIRRRVAWAVVTTAASGGGLAVLALTSGWAAAGPVAAGPGGAGNAGFGACVRWVGHGWPQRPADRGDAILGTAAHHRPGCADRAGRDGARAGEAGSAAGASPMGAGR